MAPHSSEVHHMVDQLAPAQVEALYVILRGMVTASASTGAAGGPPTAPRHRFSFVGIMDGQPDLAARSAQILREGLGNPTT